MDHAASLDATVGKLLSVRRQETVNVTLQNEAYAAAIEHMKAFPLSDAQWDGIRAFVADGKGICCAAGLRRLRELGLDAVWLRTINNWAYERLGCYRKHESDVAYDLEKLEQCRKATEPFDKSFVLGL